MSSPDNNRTSNSQNPNWQFEGEGSVLHVAGLRELSAANSDGFRERVQAELRLRHQTVELDFSDMQFMDSQGLGVLIGIQKRLLRRRGGLKVLNPAPQARKIFEMTRMGRIFEIAAPNS